MTTTALTVDDLLAAVTNDAIHTHTGDGTVPAAYWYFQDGGKYMAVTADEDLDAWWDGNIPADLGGIPLRARIDQTDWLLNAWSPREFLYRDPTGAEVRIKVPNPNSNCLDNMSCPRCGATSSFDIEATVTVKVTDDGTDSTYGYHWDDASACGCRQCGYEATVLAFDETGRP